VIGYGFGSVSDDPEKLLFTKLDGEKSDLQHVIWNGLDNDYSARVPALERLMETGTPQHRLYACVMLTSWGIPSAYKQLTAWAMHPESTPWATDPVTFERFSGADDSFEQLADAVSTAADVDPRPAGLDELRTNAARALLSSFHRVHTGRKMYELLDEKTLRASVAADIGPAAERALAALDAGKVGFDLATQTASLLGVLAPVDDAHAARVAEALLAKHVTMTRTINEVAWSLRFGTGPSTLSILERLAKTPHPSAQTIAKQSLGIRRPS
jgi:hypothetical protein